MSFLNYIVDFFFSEVREIKDKLSWKERDIFNFYACHKMVRDTERGRETKERETLKKRQIKLCFLDIAFVPEVVWGILCPVPVPHCPAVAADGTEPQLPGFLI